MKALKMVKVHKVRRRRATQSGARHVLVPRRLPKERYTK